MKVLVLGGSGMLGHKVWQVLASRFETYATLRSALTYPLLCGAERAIVGVHAENVDSVARAIVEIRPSAIVNCIGVVKQRAAAQDRITSITLNALFPHQIAAIALDIDARLLHVSTDCVFSGRQGKYREEDEPDPQDLYGRTKLLGEIEYLRTVTLRTSIIGRELSGAHGLLEWFLSQSDSVRGYTGATFSGLTTQEFAQTIGDIIEDHPDLQGVWHVAGEPITKYHLLLELARVYRRNLSIEPDDTVQVDRSLDDTRFRAATGIRKPTWSESLDLLVRDPTAYREIRAISC